MDATGMSAVFRGLTTAHVADACVRIGVEVRCAPYDLRALCPSLANRSTRLSQSVMDYRVVAGANAYTDG